MLGLLFVADYLITIYDLFCGGRADALSDLTFRGIRTLTRNRGSSSTRYCNCNSISYQDCGMGCGVSNLDLRWS